MQKNRIRLNYQPHQAQQPFHDDWYKVQHRGIIGGTGSGKSEAGAVEVIWWALKFPNSVGAMYEPSYPMVKRILIPKFEYLLGIPLESSKMITRFHKVDNKITWSNGSVTWLGSLDNPESSEGINLDYVWVDEPRLIRHLDLAVKVLLRRLRGSSYGRGQGYPTGSWWTTTPDAPGSTLHKFFEDPKDRNQNSKVYRMSIYDNRDNLPAGYIEEIERSHLGGLGDRFIWGRFAAVGLGSYPFDYTVHVVSEKIIDGVEWLVNERGQQITPLASLKYHSYGHDFGWTHPAVQLAVGWDGDGRAYILNEFYKSRASDEEIIESAKTFTEQYGEGAWHCDPSEPRTINKLSQAGLNATGYKGKFDDGIREIGGRFRDAGDGRCRLYIHRQCVNLISELQIYDADATKGSQKDDGCDTLRYVVTSQVPLGEIEISFGRRPI